MAASVEVESGIAEGELSPDIKDLRDIAKSCLKSSLDGLTVEQKAQLKTKVAAVRAQVTAAADLISKRRSKIKNQISVLQAELNAVDSGSADVNDFFRLFQPAINSCSDGQAAATQIKSLTDRALAAAYELRYQINLAKIREGLLISQAQDANDTLGTLDRINILL